MKLHISRTRTIKVVHAVTVLYKKVCCANDITRRMRRSPWDETGIVMRQLRDPTMGNRTKVRKHKVRIGKGS